MARPITVTVGPLAAASATNIRTATTANAGTMVLNGTLVSTGNSFLAIPGSYSPIQVPSGAALLDSPRQILFTNAAAETGKTIVVTGLDRQGNLQTETVTLGGIGSTATKLSYAVLLSAVLSANSAGTISVGTNTVAESQWIRLDDWMSTPYIAAQVDVNGTVNFTVQYSSDDPNSPTNPVAPGAMTWIASSTPAFANATASAQSTELFQAFAKLVLNSGTGSATLTMTQATTPPA